MIDNSVKPIELTPELLITINAINELANSRINQIDYIVAKLRKWQKIYEEEESKRNKEKWLASLDKKTRELATHCANCTSEMYKKYLKQ